MQKRFLVPIICLLLTACMAYGQPVEELDDALLIWHNWPPPESDILDEIIGRFLETHPQVEVTVESIPSDQFVDRYLDRAKSGLEPDLIVGLESFLLYELSKENLLLPLDEMEIKTDGLMPEAVDALVSDQGQIAIPFASFTTVLFYNKEMVDRPVETLDEIIEAAEAGDQFAIPTGFFNAYWGIDAFGGEVINENGEVVADNAFIAWLDWLDAAQREPTILLSHFYGDLYRSFTEGESAYFFGNSFDLPFLEEALGEGNVGVALLPGNTPEEGAGSILELQTMAISANASPPQAKLAAEMISFFTNPSQQRRIALSSYGQIPLHEAIRFDEKLVPISGVLVEQRDRSHLYPLDATETIDLLRLYGTNTYIQVLEGIAPAEVEVNDLVTELKRGDLEQDLDAVLAAQFHPVEESTKIVERADVSLLLDVLRKGGIYLNRSMVQIQLIAILVSLTVAWLISDTFWYVGSKMIATFRRPDDTIRNGTLWGYARTVGRLLYRVVEAATMPFLSFFFLLWAYYWLIDRGAMGGLLLKMEWVLGAILVYSLIIVFLSEILDEGTARSIENRYLRPAFYTGLGLAILANLADIFLVAEIILTQLFNSPVTVRALFLSTVGLYLWVGFVRIIQDILYRVISGFTKSESGDLKANLTLMRYALIIAGIGYLFTQFQFDTTTMAAITGGLSVGIGFALREILSNFISGFLLLFERSLHPGDVIEVDDQISVVESFSIRATTVRTRNNEEMIIPNQTFFTAPFKTYTGSDSKVRISLTVQTDCVINPVEVIELLKAAGAGHPAVLDDPAPSVNLLEYGNNVATFRLHVWIIEPMRSQPILSDIRIAIWDGLKENGVALPFPEVELHFPKEMIRPRQDGLPVI